MKTFHKKHPVIFAVILIAIYVVITSLMDEFSRSIGIESVFTAPFLLVFATLLLVFIVKCGFKRRYGLTYGNLNFLGCLCFVPLAVIASVNFWAGINLDLAPLPTILTVSSMLLVGFVEEIIFRGFLFKAMAKNGVVSAFIVSSVTFALGHIVNLFNGADLLPTLLQITYAGAGGFLFTTIFYKTESLLPCIITHSLLNATSVFMVDAGTTHLIISSVALIVVSIAYALWFFYKYQETDFQLDGE